MNKSLYQIRREDYTFTYRTYMARVQYSTVIMWAVYRGNHKLKSYYNHSSAVQYIKAILEGKEK